MTYCGDTDDYFGRLLYVVAILALIGYAISGPMAWFGFIIMILPMTSLYDWMLGPRAVRAVQAPRRKRKSRSKRKTLKGRKLSRRAITT